MFKKEQQKNKKQGVRLGRRRRAPERQKMGGGVGARRRQTIMAQADKISSRCPSLMVAPRRDTEVGAPWAPASFEAPEAPI